jgi:hypothetical protein
VSDWAAALTGPCASVRQRSCRRSLIGETGADITYTTLQRAGLASILPRAKWTRMQQV